MNTQMEQAKQLLYGKDGLNVSNFSLFPGSNREVTAEQIAEQIVLAITQISNGDFEDITNVED